MKNLILGLSLILSSFACADDNEKEPLFVKHITSVDVIDAKAEAVSIDEYVYKIVITLPGNIDLSQVQLKLNLAEGVTLISPEANPAVFDLSKLNQVVVKYKTQTYTYKLLVKEGSAGTEVDPTTLGWTLTTDFGKLPSYIKVYKSPAQLQGKNVNAYIAVADMNEGAVFDVLGESGLKKTPTQFYEGNSKPAIVMNGGYFGGSTSVSMICRGGEVITPNAPSENRTLNGVATPYYFTRGAFGLMNDGTYQVNWIYTVDAANKTTYAYPEPSPNLSGTTPVQKPTATYPAGAVQWKSKTAIGGGPVLLKDNRYKNTCEAELFDDASGLAVKNNHPRSAIGVTPGKKVIFFVCEGRNMTPNIPGLNMDNLANILKDLGCKDAMNLDGGGSSCMLVNGKELIKGSDRTQRPVVSAVILR